MPAPDTGVSIGSYRSKQSSGQTIIAAGDEPMDLSIGKQTTIGTIVAYKVLQEF